MPDDYGFILADAKLPKLPWKKVTALYSRWQRNQDTYVDALTRAEGYGVTFGDFGDTYDELSPDAMDATATNVTSYEEFFGGGEMPKVQPPDTLVEPTLPDLGTGVGGLMPEGFDGWKQWQDAPGGWPVNYNVIYFGQARAVCRMFQLAVARELLTIFGITNVTKGGEA